MDGGQWLTVQEFAKAAGVSDKAIYSRLNGDLKPFLKTDKKRKYVNSAALDSINFQSVESKKNQEDSNRINLIQEVERLKAERDQLREQLHALEITAAVAAAERDAARQHEQELKEMLKIAMSLHAGTIRGQLEQAASVNQSDDLAKRDAIISTDDIAKRDAVTVVSKGVAKHDAPGVAKHDAPTKHPERKKAHEVKPHAPKKQGFISAIFQKYKKR